VDVATNSITFDSDGDNLDPPVTWGVLLAFST
jgi:hypothetical protein